ncbi:MAG TPA: PrsW family intramembrane metalloprotease, partial [Longimicrobium sp.]|nr:PrsW family intramembrane metalloprotease [Longimicrobium sp.]
VGIGPGPAAAPRTPSPPGGGGEPRAHRSLTWVAVMCGLLSLLVMTADLGWRALGMGMVLAVLPVPVYVMMALWLDRFEPEPARTLAQTFAWGATVAVLIALLLNTWAEARLEQLIGVETARRFGTVFTGPVIEEVAKGAALLWLFHELRDEFDGVVDGVVYAAMVGLGFAMLENVQYYGEAIREGHHSSMITFAIRGVVGPFAHPLFTSMLGMGLGYARERHDPRIYRWAPPLGFAAAVLLHSVWNYAAGRDDVLFMTLYAAVMVPAFLGVLVVIYHSLKREGAVIREHLAVLVEQGVIDEEELDRLCVVRHRLRATWQAWRTGGVPGWRERRELHRIASDLAFHRWRVRRGLCDGTEADAVRDAEYLRRLEALCRARAALAESSSPGSFDPRAGG